ncbi:MAG: hypothetical protein KDD50_16525 [Bdellovibrionales bacterium]|nr:hypothetical protein [Bdellovibrionales bacterium]
MTKKIKKRILFMSENVTLSHVIRPLQIAESLSADEYEIHFAITHIPELLQERLSRFNLHKIDFGVSSKDLLDAIAKGKHPYSFDVLDTYVKEDCRIIKNVKPSVVVGDMRLSLHVSSKLCDVPYINISNSTWDSSSNLPVLVPETPIVKLFGLFLSRNIFGVIKPLVMRILARPFNKIAKKYGVDPYGSYFDVITSGDYTIYCDLKSLVKINKIRKKNVEVGALLYSMEEKSMEKFALPPKNKKRVVLSLGSSGPSRYLQNFIDVLAELDIELVVATLGQKVDLPKNENVLIYDYLPMTRATQGADLIIFNGGSGNGYLGLANGAPLLCIPLNIDQHNFSYAMERKGVAKIMRSDKIDVQALKRMVSSMLVDSELKLNALKLSQEILQENPVKEIQKLISKVSEEKPIRALPLDLGKRTPHLL